MIKPVNNHILIDPLKHDSFVATQSERYEEIGTIVDVPSEWEPNDTTTYVSTSPLSMPYTPRVGDKVYFDAWMAAKYNKPGTTDEFYWLVNWADVRGIEHAQDEVPK